MITHENLIERLLDMNNCYASCSALGISCDTCTQKNQIRNDVTEYENALREDERKKCVKELTKAMSKSPFVDDKLRVVKAWIAKQMKEKGEPHDD